MAMRQRNKKYQGITGSSLVTTPLYSYQQQYPNFVGQTLQEPIQPFTPNSNQAYGNWVNPNTYGMGLADPKATNPLGITDMTPTPQIKGPSSIATPSGVINPSESSTDDEPKKKKSVLPLLMNAANVGIRGWSERYARNQQDAEIRKSLNNPYMGLIGSNDGRSDNVKYGYQQFQQGGNVEELAPVTVTGIRDKETRDYYNDLQNHDLNKFYGMKMLGDEYGYSNLRYGMQFEDRDARYNPITNNTVMSPDYRKDRIFNAPSYAPQQDLDAVMGRIDGAYNSKNDLIISELAHKVQFDNDFIGNIGNWSKGFLNKKGYDADYNTPGTFEYKAHRTIEPILRDKYEKYYDAAQSDKYQQGGEVDPFEELYDQLYGDLDKISEEKVEQIEPPTEVEVDQAQQALAKKQMGREIANRPFDGFEGYQRRQRRQPGEGVDYAQSQPLEANAAAQAAHQHYVNKGLPEHVSAGIVGNLMQESGLNPHVKGDNGKATGIAQWHPDRFKGLTSWAEREKRNPYDLTTQLDYILEEPGEGQKVLQKLLQTTSAEEAAVIFSNTYERPNKKFAANDKRAGYAKGILGYASGGTYYVDDLDLLSLQNSGVKYKIIKD